MNLAIRGIDNNLGPEHADSFHRDLHKDLMADCILANPPFNSSDWGGERLREDVLWKFCVPPKLLTVELRVNDAKRLAR